MGSILRKYRVEIWDGTNPTQLIVADSTIIAFGEKDAEEIMAKSFSRQWYENRTFPLVFKSREIGCIGGAKDKYGQTAR